VWCWVVPAIWFRIIKKLRLLVESNILRVRNLLWIKKVFVSLAHPISNINCIVWFKYDLRILKGS